MVVKLLTNVKKSIKNAVREFVHHRRVASYLKSERRPWSIGYSEYRNIYLKDALKNNSLLQMFRDKSALPDRYGFRLDARLVEIPWVLAHLDNQEERVLDAGSSLNYDFILKTATLTPKKVTIVTLAPETQCHWNLGISYVYGDLRYLDFRDNWFDKVVCISTIEHVGMDNTRYAGKLNAAQQSNTEEFLLGVSELKRVLKPGGVLYITFPFGQYENHGWFQQFNSELTDKLIERFGSINFDETVFRYYSDGWKLSDRESCVCCKFFDARTSKYFDPHSAIEYPPDFPAGERAVMCLELFKK